MSISFRILTLSGFFLVAVLGFSTAHAFVCVNGTGACLDVNFQSPTTPVIAAPCNARFSQQWRLEFFAIEGIGSSTTGRKCVDVLGGGTADGTPVQLIDCNGTAAQNWAFINGGITNLHGQCLDVGTGDFGTQATIQTCNFSKPGQRWAMRSRNASWV